MTETATGKIVLGQNNYGKSDFRLVKVKRDTERHEITDVRVDVTLEGDFEATYVEGDNTRLLTTDTMRNTVYALAKDNLTCVTLLLSRGHHPIHISHLQAVASHL